MVVVVFLRVVVVLFVVLPFSVIKDWYHSLII